MTNQEKRDALTQCVALLEEVDRLQQLALKDSDVGWDNHCAIQGLVEDFEADIAEL